MAIGYNYYFKMTPSGGSATDLSDHVESMSLKRPIETKEFVTSPGGTPTTTPPTKQRELGVRDNQLDVTFKDDMASSSVHQTLELAFGSPCVIEFGFFGSTAGTTTPVYTYTAVFSDLPQGGNVGDHLTKQVSFMISSGVMAIDVTP